MQPGKIKPADLLMFLFGLALIAAAVLYAVL